jgi:hypothetical protein
MSDDRTRDDLTPITDIRGMGQAIAVIKRDVGDMRPEVKSTAKAVVELRAQQRGDDRRISALEDTTARLDRETTVLASPRPHDCVNANRICELDETNKVLALEVVNVKKDASSARHNIGELKKGQSKFVYWLMGAALVVIGSAVGWYATLQVTTNEVRHLSTEQAKIRGQLDDLQQTTKVIPVRLKEVTKRVEVAADRMDDSEWHGVRLEDVWCKMSAREKARLRRSMPLGSLAAEKCGR